MVKLSEDWLRKKSTQAVAGFLARADCQVYFVGGCVRNALLRKPVADIDIATDARPEQVMKLAISAGFKAIPTGIDHGTVTVVIDDESFEITTFRSDIKTDGRHATVRFSTSINEDAARRDFTMNAIYAAADGTVVDPLGGLPDLRAGKVRFIGDPLHRIREDGLRILRYFRFHALFADPLLGMDADGLAACAALADMLADLPSERIGAEMCKLLGAPDPSPAVAAMAASGVLARILPGATPRFLAVLIHLENHANAPASWVRRLAVIGGEAPTRNLRMTKTSARELARLSTEATATKSASELSYRFGTATALDILLIRATFDASPLPSNMTEDFALGEKAVFPVKAADLMPEYAGVALGQRLRDLEQQWIDSGFSLSKPKLLQ